jgi:4-diphosphocytidyl-2-C-methyl-D-erythritol kinase
VKLLARAPGKVNLCLFVGPLREDGRHEVVTLLESVSLADEVSVETTAGGADEVACPDVPGTNIVSRALAGLRERGWDAPPVRVTIDKRIPVAAGMGGGSADAAAMLRVAPALAPVAAGAVDEIAASLGADVASQLVPGVAIGTGAGEVVERRPALAPHAFVVVPQAFALSTADVYREVDRLGLTRDAGELSALLDEVRQIGSAVPPELLENDLERAALSLRGEIMRALDAVRYAGAAHSMVSGSGPTVLGVFTGEEAGVVAAAAASQLADRYPGATPAAPVTEEFGDPRGT